MLPSAYHVKRVRTIVTLTLPALTLAQQAFYALVMLVLRITDNHVSHSADHVRRVPTIATPTLSAVASRQVLLAIVPLVWRVMANHVP